jgi:hypothetical protein
LPDADGPGFVSLNDSFRAENRSLIGHNPTSNVLNSTPQSRHWHRWKQANVVALR